MRSSPDVVVLPEEDVVAVLHAAETTQVHTWRNIKDDDGSGNKTHAAGDCVTYYSAK